MDNKLPADSIVLYNRILIEGLGGVIGEEYANPLADGRIVIVNEADNIAVTPYFFIKRA